MKYMKQVKASFLAAGITVPSTHNEKGFRGQSWSTDYQDVGGAVNIYGLDSYAGGRESSFVRHFITYQQLTLASSCVCAT